MRDVLGFEQQFLLFLYRIHHGVETMTQPSHFIVADCGYAVFVIGHRSNMRCRLRQGRNGLDDHAPQNRQFAERGNQQKQCACAGQPQHLLRLLVELGQTHDDAKMCIIG